MLKAVLLFVFSGMLLAQKLSPEGQQAADQLKATQAELQAIKAAEAAKQAKLNELLKNYRDVHPDVVRANAELEYIRDVKAKTELRAAKMGGSNVFSDRWWRNPDTALAVGLTSDQQKKMDDVFQQYRLRLVDLNAALEREEITLDPLVSAEPLEEAKITAQIDRVAQARAELEKANGRMLLGIRRLLTPDQWNKVSQGYSLVPGQK